MYVNRKNRHAVTKLATILRAIGHIYINIYIYIYIYTQLKFKRRYLLVSLTVVADVEARPSEKSKSLSSITCGASDAGVCCASGSGVSGSTAGGVCCATAAGVCGATGSEDCCTTTPSGDVLTSGPLDWLSLLVPHDLGWVWQELLEVEFAGPQYQ